jgi:CRISPR-associated protein Cas1
VIVALGCVPGLGFVHTGHIRSFVYDIADLYKADITIPIAFDIAAREVADIGAETRRAVRDRMRDGSFLDTCVRDIKSLLDDTAEEASDQTIYGPDVFDDLDTVMLWDERGSDLPSGLNYGDER